MRSNDEIQAEITKLTEMKPSVRHYSGFGDDHHAAIDAQISVLQDMTLIDGVYDAYGDEDSDEFEQNVLDCALGASEWMMGESDTVPSEDWQSLVQE